MSRIDDIFAACREEGRAALLPFVVGGYPSMDAFAGVLNGAQAAGADMLEVGIPFSDPIADGPVIAAAMHESIESGVTPTSIFQSVSAVRADTGLGLVAMVSESIVHRIGAARFIDEAAEAGFDGLLVPDVDLDAAAELSRLTAARDMAFSLLVAPTTPADRIARIVSLCRGFVYVLARAGLTGEQSGPPEVAARLEAVRRHTDLPLAVGFGIASAEHVKHVAEQADGVIVGSALVRRMAEAADAASAATGFIAELAGGLRSATRASRA